MILKRGKSKDEKKMEPEKRSSDQDSMKNFLVGLGISFSASLVSAGYTIVVYLVANAMNSYIDYQYQAVVAILLVVISFAMYTLLILGPSLYMGLKKGVGWGIGTFVMTIVWLILFGIVTVMILFMFRREPYYPTPLFKGGGIEVQDSLQ